MNEPLASTNQYDGSMIMREVIESSENGSITTFISAHFYHFASCISESHNDRRSLFTAERLSDGRRTFKIKPVPAGEGNSWAEDVWNRIMNSDQV
ncbi:MAG: hypothetical protein ACP5UV_03910 [Thermoplasmata archaeon]